MEKTRSAKLFGKNFAGLLVVVAVGAIGSVLLTSSHAATAWTNHYPYGSIDSCSLSGSTTTIYGWANDPEALANNAANAPYVDIKVNSAGVHVATSTLAYHSNAIDSYIGAHFVNQPKSTDYSPRRDAYEFKATFNNLYKNVAYTVSGIADNYYPSGSPDGATDKPLSVNTTGTTIGGWTTSNFFANNTIPSACLVTPPAPSVSISASPTTITSGSSSTLTWSSQNVTSCAASGSWSGAQPTSNTTGKSTGALTATATYNLTCTGPGGSKTASATVTVNPTGTSHSGGGSSSGGNNTGGGGGSGSKTPSNTAPSNKADATVTTGTLGASLKVPADGASSLHIIYGTSADLLINTTDEADASGSDVTLAINGLTAKTNYYFQIVRTNSVGATNSSTANFASKGYTLAIGFEDADGNPVSDIKGSLSTSGTAEADSTTKDGKSDADGVLSFTDLAEGSYTVTFTYKGTEHTLDYNTDSLVAAGSPDEVAVLTDTVDLSQFSSGTSGEQTTKKGGSATGIILIIFLLLLVAGVIWFMRRRRRQALLLADLPAYEPVAPPMTTPPPTIAPSPKSKKSSGPSAPLPTHAGESLRDMVIKSMHAEAQKRHTDDQEPPK